MSYVPPHARKTTPVKEVKEFKKEFPQLAPPIVDDKPKLDFKKLFKNNEKRRQAKAKRMRWGMIKLTRNGIIDSLSAEERSEEERKHEEYWTGIHLEKLGERLERDHLRRLEEDSEYDPDEIVSSSSESEAESEESESSHAEDPEDDEF